MKPSRSFANTLPWLIFAVCGALLVAVQTGCLDRPHRYTPARAPLPPMPDAPAANPAVWMRATALLPVDPGAALRA